MIIDDKLIIKDLQEEFNTKFPFLKLEFYKDEHEMGEGSSNTELLPNTLTIGKARKKHNSGDMIINPSMSVNDLEKGFHDQFGLNVQVWRKSGTLWLQTITTDQWSLEEQNIHGKESVKGSEIT